MAQCYPPAMKDDFLQQFYMQFSFLHHPPPTQKNNLIKSRPLISQSTHWVDYEKKSLQVWVPELF